jgi:hypothetical protein
VQRPSCLSRFARYWVGHCGPLRRLHHPSHFHFYPREHFSCNRYPSNEQYRISEALRWALSQIGESQLHPD